MSWPNAHPSHRFVPEVDHDNLECAYCMCRPYNPEAAEPCDSAPKVTPATKGGSERNDTDS